MALCTMCDAGAEIPAGLCSAGGHKFILPPSGGAYIPNRGSYAPPAFPAHKSDFKPQSLKEQDSALPASPKPQT
jgi:hypothetical protein